MPQRRDQLQDDVSRILDLPRAEAIEAIAGLVELVNETHGGRGFRVIQDVVGMALQDRFNNCVYLGGYTQRALTVIASVVRGR